MYFAYLLSSSYLHAVEWTFCLVVKCLLFFTLFPQKKKKHLNTLVVKWLRTWAARFIPLRWRRSRILRKVLKSLLLAHLVGNSLISLWGRFVFQPPAAAPGVLLSNRRITLKWAKEAEKLCDVWAQLGYFFSPALFSPHCYARGTWASLSTTLLLLHYISFLALCYWWA